MLHSGVRDGRFCLFFVIHFILCVACFTIGSQHERVNQMLMLPVRPLFRPGLSFAQRPFLDNVVIHYRVPSTAQDRTLGQRIQQKRHFWWHSILPWGILRLRSPVRPPGSPGRPRPQQRQGPLAPTDTARTEGLNTEAGHHGENAADRGLEAITFGSSKYHHDLESFLNYARRCDLNVNTNVYKGTYFEYNVAKALKEYGFSLHRTGRANDLGIDLLGHWQLPMAPHIVKIVAQCKATQTRPAFVRELEGACQGAPLGFRGGDVMALLISDRGMTKGVRDAIQRSDMPMGFMLVNDAGCLEQFIWNAAATDAFLTGMGAVVLHDQKINLQRFSSWKNKYVGAGFEKHDRIALTWDDKRWKP